MSFLPRTFRRHQSLDVAEILSELQESGAPDWGAYVDFLHQKELRKGIGALSEIEIDVVSAYQFDVCINSSGLFSYFDTQTMWAQYGYRAMNAIGLPIYAEIVQKALESVGLLPSAKEAEISTRFAKSFRTDPDKILDAMQPWKTFSITGPALRMRLYLS